MKTFISFITPNYNGNDYLDEYFESFKNLDSKDFEIILVDDKSPKSPEEIVAKWSKVYKIKYIANVINQGPGFARNTAFKSISKKSTHFMMVDSDDRINAEELSHILDTSDLSIPLIPNKFIKFKTNSSKIIEHYSLPFAKGCGIPVCWGSIFPVEYSEIKFDSKTFEDFKWMELATKDSKYKILNSPTIQYRVRASSVTKVDKKSEKQAISLIENIQQFRKEFGSESSGASGYVRDLTLLYLYLPKKLRRKYMWPTRIKKTWVIISTLQKLSFFWKIHDFIELKNSYK